MGDHLSTSTKDSSKKKEEEVSNHEGMKSSPVHVSLNIRPVEAEMTPRLRRTLHRVPPQVREDKTHIYDPVVLSLGPYHHGLSQFRRVEELKDEVVNIICGGKDRGFICSKILERVDEIRHFYGGASKDEYDDEALAEMILRDACFVLYYIEMIAQDSREKHACILRRLGFSGFAFLTRDFFMLENQIPLWVVKTLIELTFDGDKEQGGDALLYSFSSIMHFGNHRPMRRIPWEDSEQEPLHLLEAHRTTLVVEEEKSSTKFLSQIHNPIFKFSISNPLSSVTDLKAKGIHFGPSSNCLKDIRFSSYPLHGKLQLPLLTVNINTKAFFSNIIALEMSPETDTDFAVMSYVDFMKSLIQGPEDVKELRQKGILFSCLANDEEVVGVFREIDTYGTYNKYIFQDVKMRIEKHSCSKGKTWMAELAYTYFRSPWTAIALFAATLLLCLSFLQTYISINPKK